MVPLLQMDAVGDGYHDAAAGNDGQNGIGDKSDFVAKACS